MVSLLVCLKERYHSLVYGSTAMAGVSSSINCSNIRPVVLPDSENRLMGVDEEATASECS